jgi:hypothetical protein
MKLRGVALSLVFTLVGLAIPGFAQVTLKQAMLSVKGMVCES